MLFTLSYVVQQIATLGACMSMRACMPRVKPRIPYDLIPNRNWMSTTTYGFTLDGHHLSAL